MNKVIQNKFGEKLDYTFLPGNASDKKADWIILLGHGVTGNKDRPVIADSANAMQASGWDTLAFSFAGNGDSDGDFRAATISKECDDLNAVIDSVAPHYPKIAYIGHSMGAAVGVIQAARDQRIRALVSLAGMIDTKAFALAEFGNVTPDQSFMWDDDGCPLSSAFMHDLCETVNSVYSQAQKIQIPWLLIHGTADDVVLPKDTQQIATFHGDAVSAKFIQGADHSFNDPDHKQQMLQTLIHWFAKLD